MGTTIIAWCQHDKDGRSMIGFDADPQLTSAANQFPLLNTLAQEYKGQGVINQRIADN